MSDDSVRLSDLVPEYSRYYKVTPKEAAHALHELIDDLYSEHGERRGNRLSINEIFWVGKPESSKRASKNYKFHFQLLSQYFEGFFASASEVIPACVSCYSESDERFKDIPASLVWMSRCKFSEWAVEAGIDPPDSISKAGTVRKSLEDSNDSALKTLELESIRKIMVGLVQLIKEVDKAHCEQPNNYDEKRRSDRIKLRASRLNKPPRKNSDLYRELIEFAEDAGFELVKDRQTLRRYMHGESKTSSGE
ncbi:hypothetical protein [Pseudomonas rubra]|uniref:Uncharacterized protein n=1 Tax=Pseudomonas rubra TaxID=2942627 RepID=A0ABT5PF79_9PSED|nr:hypothetical protein [Pseudomonas rubra]MDD1016980.1 hypothetical protein [Pseudomonas rubra]MDD1040262.1 hypothetical protein [Pseudomonas rubra]MDD1153351.1 hypothetical protein [Pseudomonas rubra]